MKNKNTISSGFSALELMTAMGLMGILMVVTLGFNLFKQREQKHLLYAARLCSNDVRRAREQSRDYTGTRIRLEVTTSGYRVYEDTVADPSGSRGWQEGEPILFEETLPERVVWAGAESGYPELPAAWGSDPSATGDVDVTQPGSVVEMSARSLNETALVLQLPKASAYEFVCVHVLSTGDVEVVASINSAWGPAPL